MPTRSPWLRRLAAVALAAATLHAQAAGAAEDVRADTREDIREFGDGARRLRIVVENAPDPARAALLQGWLNECARAASTAFGQLPLDYAEVRIREVPPGRDRSPVPWGQTRRDADGVAVLLFVRADAGLDELRADWTAVHELAHLFHPFLGDDGRWLAEGLASYYQNVLRARAGLLSADEAWRRLDAGFARGRRVGPGARMDAIGRGRAGTMRVYWAGAAYWLDADVTLRREHGSSLDRVLARYARCCLDGGAELSPEQFVAALDRAGGAGVFARLYRRHAALREFPAQQASYTALGLSVEDGRLQFSQRADAARLRAAIMRAPAAPDAR
ncbi:hypothetical protein K4L06_05375 [Lysobacter sp. BMK333-48F3]|uniref:M61 family metallopeptidase n=1 Tax=Lysobacter sp. BMK333-48F3 TaxID=2867962 RepID=UPI001C8C894F|nr:hypothetical protein [Lysobacter sp. BMK333-48F3]MBX9400734.1 hypothetical protein [Lysobacter sp. BMK333-48F3]